MPNYKVNKVYGNKRKATLGVDNLKKLGDTGESGMSLLRK